MTPFAFLKKKDKEQSILRPEDITELRALEREAYMEEAKKLIVEKGKADAKNNIKIRQDNIY